MPLRRVVVVYDDEITSREVVVAQVYNDKLPDNLAELHLSNLLGQAMEQVGDPGKRLLMMVNLINISSRLNAEKQDWSMPVVARQIFPVTVYFYHTSMVISPLTWEGGDQKWV